MKAHFQNVFYEVVTTEIDEAESLMTVIRQFCEDYPEHRFKFFSSFTAEDLFDRCEFDLLRMEAFLVTLDGDLIQLDWNTALAEQNDAISEIRRLMQSGQVPEVFICVNLRFVD